MKRFYVYALLDPRRAGRMEMSPCTFLEEPFYVGKGQGRRAKLHGCASSRSPAKPRIEEIASSGERVTVVILADQLAEDDAFALERYFIAQFGRASTKEGPLLNRTAGGQGMSGFAIPQSTRDAVSRAHKGKRRSPEFCAAVSAGKRGKPQTKLKGRKRDPDIGRRVSEAQRGKPRPYLVGRKVSQETKAKISAAHAGKTLSEQARAQIRETKALGLTAEERMMREFRRVVKRLRAVRSVFRSIKKERKSASKPNYETRFQPGIIPHNKGKRTGPLSEEQLAKRRGRRYTPETRAKMSMSRLGKPRPRHVIEAMLAGQVRAREKT